MYCYITNVVINFVIKSLLQNTPQSIFILFYDYGLRWQQNYWTININSYQQIKFQTQANLFPPQLSGFWKLEDVYKIVEKTESFILIQNWIKSQKDNIAENNIRIMSLSFSRIVQKKTWSPVGMHWHLNFLVSCNMCCLQHQQIIKRMIQVQFPLPAYARNIHNCK